MKPEYDVLVVGGGPSGALAAEAAAKAGVSVLLVEKRSTIGIPIRCAEGILKGDLEQFIEPNPKWIDAVIRKAEFIAPNGKKAILTSKNIIGYTLNRKLFDRELVMRAKDAGADVEVRARARPVLENGKLTGAVINQNGTEYHIRTKVIIAADGVESQFAKRAGVNTTLSLAEAGSCCEYLVSGIDIDNTANLIYFLPEKAFGGYVWVFAKGNHSANIGIGITGDTSKDGSRAKDLLDEFMKEHFPEGKILELITGGIPMSKPLAETAFDGLLIAGDAAHVTNALTGGGIYQAMYTGKLAGEYAAAAVKAGDTSKAFLTAYDSAWRNSTFGLNLQASYTAHKAYCGLSDENVNKIFSRLSDISVDNVTLRGIALAFVKNNPKLLLELPTLMKLLRG